CGVETCYSPDTWAGIVELGWTGILVPEAHGGADMGYLSMGILLEETGRQLTASPLLASALVGATALRRGGSPAQQAAWLPRVVDGSAILTLAVDEGPKHAPERIGCAATANGEGFRIDGQKAFVLEGMAASHFIVATRTAGAPLDPSGITLFLVPADAPGVSRTRLRTSDSRGYANVSFADVRVDANAVLGSVGEGGELLTEILDCARAGLAAEMLGTATQAFEMTLSYLKTRVQFGQVIGSFQALGHRAAELFTEMELTRSCVEAALQAIDAGSNDVAQLASLAKCRAGTFLYNMSNQLIQIHGGIGMTDEFDAGFYLKRARAIEAVYGNQAYHRNRYANLLGF
ncbi:MAG: acyl-CoA dehydrogenase family protein, partial [Pseudomonadales bacterium]